MKPHTTDFYKDGYSKVEFCTVCGAEGESLQLECVGIEPDKNQMDLFQQTMKKDIDTDKERN
jgi:hypothetical protein